MKKIMDSAADRAQRIVRPSFVGIVANVLLAPYLGIRRPPCSVEAKLPVRQFRIVRFFVGGGAAPDASRLLPVYDWFFLRSANVVKPNARIYLLCGLA